MPQTTLKSTIAIVGCGDVGATLAYSLLLNPVSTEVILIDPKEDLLNAQVADLRDASSRGNTGTSVRAGNHKEAGQADIIVVTAGAKQKEGEDRLSLLGRNLSILKSIFDSMQPINKDSVLLMVANPVDILTHFARVLSGLPPSQVLGTGTSLDSARLQGMLGQKLEVAASSVNAFVLGEHGDNQFVAWSSASVGTTPIKTFMDSSDFTSDFRSKIEKDVTGAAGSIIAAKGSTNFGIGNIAASICKHILFDQRTVRPVSFYQEDLGVTLSMPAILGRKGVVKAVPLDLSEEEQKKLKEVAKTLKDITEDADKEVKKIQEE